MAEDSDCNEPPPCSANYKLRGGECKDPSKERDPCSDPSVPYSMGTLENLVDQLHGISNSSTLQRENQELKKRIARMPYEWSERRAPLEEKIESIRADIRNIESEIRDMQEQVELEKKQYQERNQEYQRLLDEQKRLAAEIRAYKEKTKKIQKQFRLVQKKMGSETPLMDGIDPIEGVIGGMTKCTRPCCVCCDKINDFFKWVIRKLLYGITCCGLLNPLINMVKNQKGPGKIFKYFPCFSKRAICPLIVVFLLFLVLWYLGIIIFQCKYPFPGGYLPGGGKPGKGGGGGGGDAGGKGGDAGGKGGDAGGKGGDAGGKGGDAGGKGGDAGGKNGDAGGKNGENGKGGGDAAKGGDDKGKAGGKDGGGAGKDAPKDGKDASKDTGGDKAKGGAPPAKKDTKGRAARSAKRAR